MKRDMDLVREILLYAEQHATPSNPCSVKIEGRSEEEVSYHLRLMRDAGLIDARTPGGSIWAVLGLRRQRRARPSATCCLITTL
jgi:hypothetical protein